MWKLFLFFGLICNGQTLRLREVTPAGTLPSARFDGTVAYSSAGKEIYLFGGDDGAPRNDLWAYSIDRNEWREVTAVQGTKPAARFGHTLVYDSARNRLVLFGGQAGGFFSDLWAFDISGGSWQKLAADDTGPSRRYGHSAIYDAERDRMVVSHGFTDAGRFDDTWAFDFRANSWINISPADGRPLRRCLHRAVYDPARAQMLFFGGCASGFGPCPLGDLWSFDLRTNRWRQVSVTPSPRPREHYGVAFDTGREKMIVFGGQGSGLLNDTWEFDPRAERWTQVLSDGPAPRQRHHGVFAEGAVYFFGGTTPRGNLNELLALRPALFIANAFSGVGGAVAPGEIVSIYGAESGPAEGVSSLDLPRSLGGVTVSFDGVEAPLFFVRNDQINALVPELAPAAETRVVIGSVEGVVRVQAAHPGLVPMNLEGARGDVVGLFVTGAGESFQVRIGDRAAEVMSRSQVAAGVRQVDVRIPTDSAVGRLPVVLRSNGFESQPGVFVTVKE